MKPDVLQQLKDIHPPAQVDWWPLAPAWWLLLVLCVVVIGLIVYYLRRQSRSAPGVSGLKQAAQLLEQAHSHWQHDQDTARFVARLSTLMRRVLLTYRAREEVAGLTGAQWLHVLDEDMPGKPFSSGAGSLLLSAAYQQQVNDDPLPLYQLCCQKLDQLRQG